MDKFYPTVGEVNENVTSHSQSSDDKLDNSHSYKADEQVAEEARQVHPAPATARPSSIHTWRRKRKSTCVASKRSRKHENNYTVIINWMDWYANEDDEENIKPLHNKRMERRTKQRLLKNPTDVNMELQATDDPSCTKNDGDFDMDLINSGKDKSCNSTEGSTQELLIDGNDKNDHIGKSLRGCDDHMQLDTYHTSQGCVVRSPFHVSRTLSVDVNDGCGKPVNLDNERDDVVDLIDLD